MGTVQDFERDLIRRAKPRAARWHRIDLHNHTPASFDYRYKGPDALERTIDQIQQKDLSVVMFTDHERLPEQSFVDRVARDTGRLILRGVELSVFVDGFDRAERKVTKEMFYHLLLGFDPSGIHPPDYWLEEIYRRGGVDERDTPTRKIKGVTCSPATLSEILEEANAIMIPAHLHTVKDPSKTRSVDDIYNDAVFLGHARDSFTALEVVSAETAEFFDGKHTETNSLHKVCIRSSDSHESEALGWRHSFAQMEDPSYQELKAALELPFRVNLDEPGRPASSIVGVHIVGAFFPDLWLAFSAHCNMLIAVKGSGKTSVLECLRFALGVDIPKSRVESVAQHLRAILGPNGSVQVLVKRDDGAKVLVSRSISDSVFHLTFEDDRREEFTSPDALLFPIQILGWHEIEQAATDPNVRRVYMDTIAGRARVRSLEEDATAIASRVRDRHAYASQKYAAYRDVQRQVSRLSELRRGLRELTEGALIEVRDRYQSATEQREACDRVIGRLRQLRSDGMRSLTSDLPKGADIPDVQSPLEEVIRPVRNKLLVLEEVLRGQDGLVVTEIENAVREVEAQKETINTRFEHFLKEYEERLSTLTPEQRRLLESHREVLEQTKALGSLELVS